MRVTTIDHFTPDPGTLLRWTVDASASTWIRSAVPPSFNQGYHLATAMAHPSGGSTWLAASFDVTGTIDLKAMERAYHALIARHGTLHSGFVVDGDRPIRRLHDPSTLRLVPRDPEPIATGAEMRRVLWAGLSESCPPFGEPSCFLAAIDRIDRSTVVCGFDHAHVDAYSMAIVVDDLSRLYAGFSTEPGAFDARTLPTAGSFVDYCADEALDDRDYSAHPAMAGWVEFFTRHANRPPTFPLDLGVTPGERAPQAVDLRMVLDDRATAAFGAVCRDVGAGVYAGVLAVMAHAIADLGGGHELPVLFPMHTRRSRRWENAMGWFTTNAPVTIGVEDTVRASIALAGPAVRAAVALGEIPVPRVLETIGGLRPGRSDIFMVSYVDYRRLPGSRSHHSAAAHHISNVTTADDAQFWISRTDAGLSLRTRFPDTPVAREVMPAFLERVVAGLAGVSAGTEPTTPAQPCDGGEGDH